MKGFSCVLGLILDFNVQTLHHHFHLWSNKNFLNNGFLCSMLSVLHEINKLGLPVANHQICIHLVLKVYFSVVIQFWKQFDTVWWGIRIDIWTSVLYKRSFEARKLFLARNSTPLFNLPQLPIASKTSPPNNFLLGFFPIKSLNTLLVDFFLIDLKHPYSLIMVKLLNLLICVTVLLWH